MRIEVCGGVASGQTTFVRALNVYLSQYAAVYEDPTSITLLDDFYKNIPLYAFETEVSFLLYHLHQIKYVSVNKSDLICDFCIEQDYAYAINNLNLSSRRSFDEIYKEVVRQIDCANLIIFLQCPTDVLLDRIHARGRNNESDIDVLYIDNTVRTLQNHILKMKNKDILTIDSNKFDFRNTDDMKKIYTEYIKMYV